VDQPSVHASVQAMIAAAHRRAPLKRIESHDRARSKQPETTIFHTLQPLEDPRAPGRGKRIAAAARAVQGRNSRTIDFVYPSDPRKSLGGDPRNSGARSGIDAGSIDSSVERGRRWGGYDSKPPAPRHWETSEVDPPELCLRGRTRCADSFSTTSLQRTSTSIQDFWEIDITRCAIVFTHRRPVDLGPATAN